MHNYLLLTQMLMGILRRLKVAMAADAAVAGPAVRSPMNTIPVWNTSVQARLF